MTGTTTPAAVTATEVPPRATSSNVPAPFEQLTDHRDRRAPGEVFGLGTFGVSPTGNGPGGASALIHGHGLQDGFICVLEDGAGAGDARGRDAAGSRHVRRVSGQGHRRSSRSAASFRCGGRP